VSHQQQEQDVLSGVEKNSQMTIEEQMSEVAASRLDV